MKEVNPIRTPWIIIFSLLMTSCSFFNRSIHKEPVIIPAKWDAINAQLTTSEQNLSCIAWWKQFKDPALNALIEKGLKRNNDIHVATANIEAALGELKRVKLNWIPGVNELAGYSSFPNLGFPGVVVAAIPTYTLNVLSQIKEQQKAQFSVKITKNTRDTVKLAVIAQIAESYFNHLAEIEQLKLLQAVERDVKEDVAINKSTYSGGLSSDITLSQAESRLNLIQSEEFVIKKNIIASQNMMRYLLNENPAKWSFTQTFSQINSHQMIIGALPINVIENRPDLMEAMNTLKVTHAGVGLAISNFLPTIQLSALFGDIGTVPNGTHLGMPITFKQGLLEGPLINLSNFGELDKARGLKKAAYYRYLNVLRKILRDVSTDLSAQSFYSQRLHETTRAEKNLDNAYQLNRDLYQKGIISYATLLKEKTELDKIKITVNQHKLEQLITIVKLYQDLAVGYGCS